MHNFDFSEFYLLQYFYFLHCFLLAIFNVFFNVKFLLSICYIMQVRYQYDDILSDSRLWEEGHNANADPFL